jgi:CHAT domain-containing protein/tetratricopeptide (TPR) repeat protein
MTQGRRETMMLVGAGVATLLLPLPALGQARETAEAAAFAARALADQGKQAEALQRLERWLRTAPAEWRANDPNVPVLLLEAGRYAAALGERQKAITHLGQAAELARKHFAQSPAIRGQILREVARAYDGLGDYARSVPQYQAAVSAFERVSKLAAAEAANGLGIAQLELLRPADAATSLTRALTLLRGAGEPDPATEVAILVNLSNAELGAGRLDAAADAAAEATQRAGDTLPLLRAAWLAEARVRLRAADMAGAETLLRRVIATTPAGEDEAHAHARFQLAIALFGRGLFVEAEQEALAAETAYMARFGPNHPIRARVLHTLGTIYHEMGDLGAAEALYKQAIILKRAAFGAQSAQVHSTEIELSALELQVGRVDDGDRRARASITALRASRLPDRRLEGLATVVTGLALEQKGDAPGAIERYREAQRLIEEARGPFAQELGFSLVKMGRLLTRQRRYGEAETALARAIGLYEQLEATGALRLADALIAMAELRQAVGNRRGALQDSRRAFALLKVRNTLAMGGGASGAFEARSAHDLFGAHAALVLSLSPDARAEALEASELALSSVTGFTVQQVAARFSVRDDRLGQMIRTRQDAFERVSYLEQVRRDRLTRPGSRVEPTLDAELRQWRETLTSAIAELDQAFPEYQRLVQPAAVALSALQGALRDGEAVLMPLVLESETIVWLVTAGSVAVHRERGLPRAAVNAAVARIRRSVDLSEVRQLSDVRPFDFAASDMLYKGLVQPFSDTLASITQLLFIPDGALQSLPPHLLAPLSDGVDARDLSSYGRAAWLGLRIPVSIAPSASAIVAMRATNRPSAATRELLGFGDPVFSGARRVPAALAPRWAAVRAGTVKRSDIASLQRLPQTRDELNAIAAILGPDRSDLFLGDDASERWLGAVRTDDYRVISFASHALMPGELPGLREPAIVLTPDPDDDSVFDGLLTPAEIAQLRLDADLVILSACNTASADGSGLGEGLSGLGRAFFFAGARGLLVSHWAVESTVTAALIADVVARTREEPAKGAAAALAGAMRGKFGAEAWLQHPAFWAAFVAVGV